jgi:hypothetical protein
MHVDKL